MSQLAHAELKHQARRRVADQQPRLEELNLWLHDNPETAYQEYQSSARLSQMLEGYGFTVEYPAYSLDTSFAARSGQEGPELVICAEYDALPGIGHACGHNIIASSAVGAGLALQPLTEELGFRVTVLGTPAEEGYGGKVDLINAGAFGDAAAAMMVHPSPATWWTRRLWPSVTWRWRFTGRRLTPPRSPRRASTHLTGSSSPM